MKNSKMLLTALASVAMLISCKKNESAATETSNEDNATTEVVETETSVEPIESTAAITSSNEDWDKMLDDYEEYVDQYVILYKKMKAGDNSAMSEYPQFLEKANDLQASMERAQNEDQLSTQQITRMTKIQTKMLSAMQ